MSKSKIPVVWLQITKPNSNEGPTPKCLCLQLCTPDHTRTIFDSWGDEIWDTAVGALNQQSVLSAIAHDIRHALEIRADEVKHAEMLKVQQAWSTAERIARLSGDSGDGWSVPQTGVKAGKKTPDGP